MSAANSSRRETSVSTCRSKLLTRSDNDPAWPGAPNFPSNCVIRSCTERPDAVVVYQWETCHCTLITYLALCLWPPLTIGVVTLIGRVPVPAVKARLVPAHPRG